MAVNYVKNADLRKELIKSKEQDELTPVALEMIMLMAKRFADKLQYKYPEDKQDCIAVAIMDCFLYWRNYNPEKSSNAFAYISQIVKMGMCKSFRKIYGKFPLSKRVSVNHSKIYTI